MRCSNCGVDNPEGLKFCNECGAPFRRRCAKCGFENAPTAKFCGECATPLNVPAGPRSAQTPEQAVHTAAATDSESVADDERKTVTALFADIKGSMELMEDLDPEEARTIIDPALKLMIEAVRRYGGYVVQSTGDGIFALFGAPIAHEDHPQRALYAALRLQEEMRRYSGQLRQAGNLPVEARVGVNTGEVVVRSIATGENHPEYTPIGHSTSLAARMQALAPTGSIAVTDGTRKLCEGYFTFRTLGPARVKGVSEPVEVFEVIGLGPLRTRLQVAARRGLTRFVGREREMEALRHAAGIARTGHGQLVAAMGEPGAGKSRLFHEFKLISQSEWMTLEAFSVSHGKASAYLPVIELLHGYFEITSEDDGRKRREKAGGKVLMLDRALEDALPYLFSLLGIADTPDPLAQMDGQVKKRRTLEAIKRMLLRESLNQPLMLIFEDLHWIDGETQALLNLLADAIANARILLMVNYRPEYHHEWGNRTYYNQLRLDPLGRETAEEMLDALLLMPLARSFAGEGKRGDEPRAGEGADLTALKRLIIERTQGNPFFMEETVQALLDEGALVRNGTVKLTKPLSDLKIPLTVQAMLSARIDRLPPAEKELLQTLAVIGKELALELVKGVTGKREEQLAPMLANLQLGEFIYEQPSVAGAAYIFKHALTQEVAYNSLLAERRHTIHEQIGRAIEAIYAPQLEDRYADLAYNYLRGSDAVKALQYAHLAAEQAMDRGAYPEAASIIQTGLKLLEKLPENTELRRGELRLRSIQVVLERATHGASSSENDRVIRRMCELAKEIGESEQLLRALLALSTLHFTRGEVARGLEVGRRCIGLAESVQDARLRADAHWRAGILAQHSGRLQEAITHIEDAIRHSGQASPSISTFGFSFRTLLLTGLAQTLQLLGQSDRALKLAEEGLRHSRESKRLYELGALLSVINVTFHCYRREPEIVRLHTEEAIVLAEESGFVEWLHLGRFFHGWSLAELGQLEPGIAEMETAIADFGRLGGVPLQQFATAFLAQGYARMGRTDEALVMLSRVLARIENTGEKIAQAEILRLKGEVLLMRDGAATAEAEHCFHASLEVARQQEARWWELRSSVSLARLLRDTNRRDEARSILAEIYNWFTEGFDLPDLKEAKALLDELSSPAA